MTKQETQLAGTKADLITYDELDGVDTSSIAGLMTGYGLTAEQAQNVFNYAKMIRMRDEAGRASKYAGGRMVSPKLIHRKMERLVERAQVREAGIRKILRILDRATGGRVASDNDAALRLMEQKGL
ncbi:hypothetical protein PR1_92 [Providencia phage vB_PreS_PR1]|uniref:Uncharacterized protein n=1 Tax=Providencia phage vB_PreS_PR1 TaxID=1931407 RepID=A0A1S6KV54_9CAUD|nr:hypothetical protein FDH30_gp123 [Providencia phage vB_PreS_PR1]AQT25291.1 hypothetical protein PR1_92 [Providencia phage vB_PreS_PR1]